MKTELSRTRRSWWRVLPGSVTALMWACGAPPAAAPLGLVSELPVTRVVLYQNGVGYFERSGSVDGDVLNLDDAGEQVAGPLRSTPRSCSTVTAACGRRACACCVSWMANW